MCGVVYKIGSVIKIPAIDPDSDFFLACIDLIIVVNDQNCFVYRRLSICDFNDHFYTYEVQQSPAIGIIQCSGLVQQCALCLRKVAGRLLVTDKVSTVFHVPGLSN